MTKGIYVYIDKKDDTVVYVGKDSNIDKNSRHKDHLQPNNYNKQPFNSILQNNPDRYEYHKLFKLSDNFTDKDLNELEKCFIEEFNTFHYVNPRGFNFTLGGEGCTGYIPSEETRRKLSERSKKMWEDDERRKQQSERSKKMWENTEYRQKISQKMSESWTDERRKQQSERNKEMWRDEEYSQKMSQKMSEKWEDEEYRQKTGQKISEVLTGRKFSEEHKRRISENHADFSGMNHPNAKYGNLWDILIVHYHKKNMFQCGREPNPCKCFIYRYKGKDVPIGMFHDFISCEIINDLVLDAIEEGAD